jgi:hypothetical protein
MGQLLAHVWTTIKILIGLVFLVFVYTCASMMSGAADSAPGTKPQGAVPTATPAVAATATCSPGSFNITTGRSSSEAGLARISASVTNNGTAACGVQIKLATFDATGTLLQAEDFWPASVRNIMPGATEHFSHSIPANRALATYSLTAIAAREWRQ